MFSDSDSDRECLLAPRLKRLRLNEDYDCPIIVEPDELEPETGEELPEGDHDMAVEEAEKALGVCRPPLLDVCAGIRAFGGNPVPGGSRAQFSSVEAWRAELQRRAMEEFRKYRQQVHSLEAGPLIRPCSGY